MKNSLRVARAEVRMTQQQLADAVGVSRQTINAIESGKFVPSTVLALKIARCFGKAVEAVSSSRRGTDAPPGHNGCPPRSAANPPRNGPKTDFQTDPRTGLQTSPGTGPQARLLQEKTIRPRIRGA